MGVMSVNEMFIHMRKLKLYNRFSDERLLERAKKEVEKRKKREKQKATKDFDYGIDISFKSRDENELARRLIIKYFEDFTIESISDKNILKEIIMLEVIQNRLHEKLNLAYETKSQALSLEMLGAIQKNSEAIIKLKNTLGLNRRKEDKKDSYDVLQHLMERAKVWRENNVGSRQLVCPHCSKMVLLKIRLDKYDAIAHPHFKDKILFNKHLVYLYLKKVITERDVALILNCSEDYTNTMVNKIWKTNPEYIKIIDVISEEKKESQSEITAIEDTSNELQNQRENSV